MKDISLRMSPQRFVWWVLLYYACIYVRCICKIERYDACPCRCTGGTESHGIYYLPSYPFSLICNCARSMVNSCYYRMLELLQLLPHFTPHTESSSISSRTTLAAAKWMCATAVYLSGRNSALWSDSPFDFNNTNNHSWTLHVACCERLVAPSNATHNRAAESRPQASNTSSAHTSWGMHVCEKRRGNKLLWFVWEGRCFSDRKKILKNHTSWHKERRAVCILQAVSVMQYMQTISHAVQLGV